MTLMTSDHHQIWHTDREYEYDGLYDIFFFDDFMRNSNFGIGVYMLNIKYWRIFCDIISLPLKFL